MQGSVRESEVPCPINIAGLAKLYNAVTQYKIDHEYGNFAQYLQDPSKKVCKAAQPEWSGWQTYHAKYVARVRRLNEVGERVIPVKEGSEMMSINPPLITMRKGFLEGTIICALTVSTGLGVVAYPLFSGMKTQTRCMTRATLKNFQLHKSITFKIFYTWISNT